MAQPWRLDSWRGKPILQVPEYPDTGALGEVERHLHNFPPLVFIKEVRDLKAKLAAVAAGSGFLLQGTDRVGAMTKTLKTLADAKINVTAMDAVTSGDGRFAAIFWVKPKKVAKAAKLLRAR